MGSVQSPRGPETRRNSEKVSVGRLFFFSPNSESPRGTCNVFFLFSFFPILRKSARDLQRLFSFFFFPNSEKVRVGLATSLLRMEAHGNSLLGYLLFFYKKKLKQRHHRLTFLFFVPGTGRVPRHYTVGRYAI